MSARLLAASCPPTLLRVHPSLLSRVSVRIRGTSKMSAVSGSQTDMEARVRQMYDYDAVIANAPEPETVEWVFGYGSIVFRQGLRPGTV